MTHSVIKRFFAEAVACEKKLFCRWVPNGKSEHADQSLSEARSVLLIEMHDDLSV